MINPSLVQKITQASSQNVQKVLHEGSSVNVRIISDKGNGSYVGTVAGARVNIHSAKNLAVGKSFPATISIKNGIIYVVPKGNDSAFALEKSVIHALPDAVIAGKLNLPFDELMSELINYSRQMEMKLDSSFLLKVKNLALRFKGKEISAGKLLLLLAQKNIELSEEQILSLLNYLENHSEREENHESKKSINRINSVNGSWFIVPYELVQVKKNQLENVLASGIAKFFYTKENQLKLLNFDCVKGEENYFFNLFFEKNVCTTVQFCTNSSKKDLIRERLSKFNVEVEETEKSIIENYSFEDSQYFSFESEV